jgi:O-antigen/teichoic acid export membrane protein
MVKSMMNREIAIIAICSMVTAGMSAVILALRGYSYWSLVANQIVYAICFDIGRLYYVRWRPSLRFDAKPIKNMFGFSSKLLITQLFFVLNQHLLTFVFGRFFPIRSVGYYTQATKWCNMAKSTISGSIGQIAQPMFVSIASEPDREINALRKLVRFTSFVTFPAMFGLALVSHEFVIIVLGERWVNCILMLQILCIGAAFIPLSEIYQNMLVSNNRSDLYMWGNICQVSLMLILAICFFRYGIITIVCVNSAYTILWILLWQAICCRYIGGHFIDFIKDIAPFAAITALVMGITYFLTYSINNQWLCLISRIVIAIILYLTIMKLAKAKVLDECIDFISKRKKQANVFP